MLVTFTTPVYADITMFGDVALTLLKMMGHSGTVPGAILAEDVPAALERLQQGIETIKAATEDKGKQAEQEDPDARRVSLPHRAWPLIELLRAAAKEKCDVMWK